MGRHFSDAELDTIQRLKAESLTPIEIHARPVKERKRLRQKGPDLTTARRFVKGKTQKRSATESRGRKRALSAANLNTMGRVRDELTAKSEGQREIAWDEVVRKSRVKKVHRTRSCASPASARHRARPPHRQTGRTFRGASFWNSEMSTPDFSPAQSPATQA